VNENTTRDLINILYERATLLEPQLNEIACSMVTQGPFAGYAPFLGRKLIAAELCADFSTPYPHFHLRVLARRLREQFTAVKSTNYGPTAKGYAELLHDANIIHGYNVAGQIFKIYEKTNNRLRLEFASAGSGLKSFSSLSAEQRQEIAETDGRACPSDPREFRDEEEFVALFGRLITRALPHFNAVRGNTPEPDDHGSVFELISQVAGVLSRHTPTELERMSRVLTLEGRLTSRTLTWASLQRLVRAGVLQQSVPGIYAPTPRYRRVLRMLRIVDGRWQGSLRRDAA
jgi:hypothetical protein